VQGILQMGRQHGFPVLLVTYPYPVMMANRRLENEHTKFWREFAELNGVTVVNLAGQFVEKDTPPEKTYGKYFIPGDFHWNDEGNRKVAEILAPQVLEKNDIGFSRKSRYIKL